MIEIVRCNEEDYVTLAGIWERSVMATHSFLKESDFNELKSVLIPDYFPNVDLYAIADNGVYAGFIGLSPDTIEMLFRACSLKFRGRRGRKAPTTPKF